MSEKGHGGGWELRADLRDITLLDVPAIGSPALFSIGPAADPSPCLVEHAVDARLDQRWVKPKRYCCSALARLPWRTSPKITCKMASLGLDPHTFPRCSD